MLNINPKLLETLKKKNININFKFLNEASNISKSADLSSDGSTGNPNSRKISEEYLNKTSSKIIKNEFRCRPCTPSEILAYQERPGTANLNKEFKIRPGTVSQKDNDDKFRMTQTLSNFLKRPGSSKGNTSISYTQTKDKSLMKEDDDINNDASIKFYNLDKNIETNIGEIRIDEELEEFKDITDLDEEKLCNITGYDKQNLQNLIKLELKVNLTLNSLQEAGYILESLKELKLNGSIINSLRDIGNSFKGLEILWIAQCGIKDLGGLSSFPKLIELYAAYNNIKDLNDIIFHENLQVIDLEGNEIDDFETLSNLNGLDNLNMLVLNDNPIAKKRNYKQNVFKILHHVNILDDTKREDIADMNNNKITEGSNITKKSEGNLSNKNNNDNQPNYNELFNKFRKFGILSDKEIENTVQESNADDIIQEPLDEEIITMSVKKTSGKMRNMIRENDNTHKVNLCMDIRMSTSMYDKKIWQRPQTANTKAIATYRPTTNNIFNEKPESFSSDLVQKTDKAFSGNPIKALKHRRMNQFIVEEQNKLGEMIAKPKNIINLIEEFSITNKQDVNLAYEEIFGNDLKNTDDSMDQNINITVKKNNLFIEEEDNRAITINNNDNIVPDSPLSEVQVHAPKIKSTRRVLVGKQDGFKKMPVDVMNKFLDVDTKPLDIGKMLKERGSRVKITTTGIRKKDISLLPLNNDSSNKITS